MNLSRSFLTGSYAYGKPKAGSAIDLVVFVTEVEWNDLVEQADARNGCNYGGRGLRFGNLNLICCLEESQFECWWQGTRDLKKRKPVNHQQACDHFYQLAKAMGIPWNKMKPKERGIENLKPTKKPIGFNLLEPGYDPIGNDDFDIPF